MQQLSPNRLQPPGSMHLVIPKKKHTHTQIITEFQLDLNCVDGVHLLLQHILLGIEHFSSLDCSKSPFEAHHGFQF